jgi:hypothetical protein
MNCTNPKTLVERKHKVLVKKVSIGSNLESSLDKVEEKRQTNLKIVDSIVILDLERDKCYL